MSNCKVNGEGLHDGYSLVDYQCSFVCCDGLWSWAEGRSGRESEHSDWCWSLNLHGFVWTWASDKVE